MEGKFNTTFWLVDAYTGTVPVTQMALPLDDGVIVGCEKPVVAFDGKARCAMGVAETRLQARSTAEKMRAAIVEKG